jgi:hypothetical protein
MEEAKSRCDMACEVLQKTHDGDDLAPFHLWLLQEWVNDHLNEKGEALFREMHQQVMAGTYTKPWVQGVEHLTRDHEGYIYWKGIQVEHFSFSGKGCQEREKAAAEELARRCRILESKGIPVSCAHAIWKWDNSKPEGGY